MTPTAPITPAPAAPLPWAAEYATFHAGVLRGIDAEIKAVISSITKWGGEKPVSLRSATLDGAEGESYLYTLYLDRDVRPPEFTAVDIHVRGGVVKGLVEEVSPDGMTLTVATEDTLPANVSDAHLSFDPTRMLKELQNRFNETAPGSTHRSMPLVRKLLGYDTPRIGDIVPTHPSIAARAMTDGQRTAIGRGVGSEICLVFGPPGTGKTRTLGSLVAELAARGKRVLVTAHTNGALDTAMQSVVDAVGPGMVHQGQVVRAGKVSKEFRHLHIGSREVAARTSGAVSAELLADLTRIELVVNAICPPLGNRSLKRLQSLASSKRAAPRRSLTVEERIRDLLGRIGTVGFSGMERPELEQARTELKAMEAARAASQTNAALTAQIVGATLTKLSLDPGTLGDFDTVVIDEGSMVMLPQAVAATLLAREQVIMLGDPCQLPPVVQSDANDAKYYLATDLYSHLGLDDPGVDDPRRPMLTEQFRMRPEIRALVSRTFYANRLTDHPSVLQASIDRGDIPREGLILLDTSVPGVASERKGGSRINTSHVDIVTALVRQLSDSGERSIGVITPFRPQMQLLRSAITQEIPGFFRAGGMLRTIHGSQGGEKSTIILDLVDAPPQLSSFLDDSWNTDLPRLINVALSRAQHRLIVVAHAKSLRQKYQKSGALVMRILECVYREGTYAPLGADLVVPQMLGRSPGQDELDLGTGSGTPILSSMSYKAPTRR